MTRALPLHHRHIANMAGYAGYRAICQRIVRNELVTGRDDLASDAYSPPNRLASISHRLALALDREAELDTSNTWNWTQYCEPDPDHGTSIHWADVVVAGHSFGGNQAAYIAYRTPTQGAFVIDSGYDTCESEFPASTYDIYDDDLSDYNTTGEAALWYSTFTRATTDWVFALHEQDIFPSVVRPELPPSMEFYVPNAVDDTTGWPEDGAWFDNDADADTGDTGFQQGTWAGERFIATSQAAAVPRPPPENDPSCTAILQPHGSMANDNCMPNHLGTYADPLQATSGTSSVELFSAFVDVFCALGD